MPLKRSILVKDFSSISYACCHKMANISDTISFGLLLIVVFLSYLCVNRSAVSGIRLKHSNLTKELRSPRGDITKINNEFKMNNTSKDKGSRRQVQSRIIHNKTNELRKRTMKGDTRLSLKSLVNRRAFAKALKSRRLQASSPLVRSRLSSLRSSTFKPIHIYGSVPFKTFLTALSKSPAQGNAASPVNRAYGASSLPQGTQEPSSMPQDATPGGLMQDKPMDLRQFPIPNGMPVPVPLPMEGQGNFPMFSDGPGPMMYPGPFQGGVPVYPENIPLFNNPEAYHMDHHGVHHNLHHKAFTRAKCFPNPCQNGGLCTAFSTTYECTCPLGYKGHSCEERNECVPNPCKNGGNCYDDDGNYKCTCVRGYTGYNCEEMSKCMPNPCKNGATCVEGGESYECECPQHFNGHHCEVHDYCGQDNPCMNGGSCANIDKGFECTCAHGFQGHACEDVDVCHENPCENEGLCKNSENGQFSCKCGHGFRGMMCEEKVPPCEVEPCNNGGTCLEEGDRYVCHCPEHFKGRTCEVAIHTPCSGNPCENGGSCVAMEYGDYKCQCPHDFGGIHCEVQAQPVCYSCHEHATCKNDKCECLEGYTGSGHHCEVVSHCHPNPCYNGGACHDHSTDYECICADGFMGKSCKDPMPCLASPCQNGGTCVDQIGSCSAGMPCHSQSYECTCPLDFYGDNCEHPSPCHPNPCENGGECVAETTTYVCQCPIRYTGHKCQEDKCGSCDVNGNCDKGKCVCNQGFVGQGTKGTCKPLTPTVPPTPAVGLSPPRPTDPVGLSPGRQPTEPTALSPPRSPCQPNPCQQGGTCTPVGAADFTCQCPPAYTGKTCTEQAKSYCHPSPCLNGGICIEVPNGYKCQCVGHYRGTNCQEDDCDRCDIRAVCIKGKCKCRDGYRGDGYQCSKSE